MTMAKGVIRFLVGQNGFVSASAMTDQAEDLVQEAWLRVLKSRGRLLFRHQFRRSRRGGRLLPLDDEKTA